MSAVVVAAGDAELWLTVPACWASGPVGADTVLWDPRREDVFRTNVLVRVHSAPEHVDLDALCGFVDDELEALDAQGAAVERRGRTELGVAGGRGVGVLALFDVDAPDRTRFRVAQLHALVEATSPGAREQRSVFHLVATGDLAAAPRWSDDVVAIVTSAALQRGTRAAPR